MAVPQRRTSLAKKRRRRTHQKIVVASLQTCTNCLKLKHPAIVCPYCGHFKGKEIMEVKK